MCGGQLRQNNDLPKRKEVTGGGLDGSGPSHRKRVIGWRDAEGGHRVLGMGGGRI